SLFAKAQALVRIHPDSVVCPPPRLQDSVRRLHRFYQAGHPRCPGNRQVPRAPLPTVGVTSHGETWSASSEDITPRSSLIRTHAPNPSGSPFLRFFPSVGESLQVATSPCCQRVLPDSISANLSPDAWSPAPTGPTECSYLFLPRCHRPSPRHYGSASRLVP